MYILEIFSLSPYSQHASKGRQTKPSQHPHRVHGKQAQQQLSGPLRLSKTLVAMYPLLGLLGTVSGMIAVFDVLALSGTGNPRGMAAGVWQATLPTMAGMVLAITGLFSLARLERIARQSLDRLADQLRHD